MHLGLIKWKLGKNEVKSEFHGGERFAQVVKVVKLGKKSHNYFDFFPQSTPWSQVIKTT